MEIHKPRPWHGLREFLKEYAIIVLGILTALGGEQAIEAAHQANEAKATEAALRHEVGVSLISAAERVMIDKCLKARLVGLSRALSQGGDWRANPLPLASVGVGDFRMGLPQVYRAPIRPWNNASWQAVMASGGVAHMSEPQLRAYGSYYRSIDSLRSGQDGEEAWIAAIQPLAYDQTLSADKRAEMQANIAALDRINFQMVLASGQLIERARRDGLPADVAQLEARYRSASSLFGNCVQRLGSTASALSRSVPR